MHVKISALSNFRTSFAKPVPQKISSNGKDLDIQVSPEHVSTLLSRGTKDSDVRGGRSSSYFPLVEGYKRVI